MFPSTTLSFNLKPGAALGDAVTTIQDFEKQSGKPASLATTFQGSSLKGVGKSEFGGRLAIAKGGSGLA